MRLLGYRGVLAAAVVALLAANANHAQAQSTASSTADAVIATPITLSNTAGLDFGTILAGTVASTVQLTAAGAPTRTVTAGDATLASSTISAAAFSVNGTANQTYAITLPADGAVTLTGPGPAMAVNGFTHDAGATPTLTGSPPDTLYVGATLSVGASQTAGSYSGSFDVTVAYN